MPVAAFSEISDADLIRDTVAGNQRAFGQLVSRYSSLVYNFIYRMTANHELSEEMTQEAFVKAYHHLNRFDCNRPFRPWLLRIASNATVSALRKQSKTISLDALTEEQPGQTPVALVGEDILCFLEQKLVVQELQDILETVLGDMELKYRQVLLLRYQQELSYEEIAQVMQTPMNTIRTWLKRGLEKLKQEVLKRQEISA